MKTEFAKLTNRIYDHAPALHRATYNLYKRWSDGAERRLLRQLITPGMTVLDLGANIGIYTEFLAKLVGPSGCVVAFEPEQRNVERLRDPAQKYKQIEVVNAAVSDHEYVNLMAARSLRSSRYVERPNAQPSRALRGTACRCWAEIAHSENGSCSDSASNASAHTR